MKYMVIKIIHVLTKSAHTWRGGKLWQSRGALGFRSLCPGPALWWLQGNQHDGEEKYWETSMRPIPGPASGTLTPDLEPTHPWGYAWWSWVCSESWPLSLSCLPPLDTMRWGCWRRSLPCCWPLLRPGQLDFKLLY